VTGSARAIDARKMHGAHNVFVLLDERSARLREYAELARTLCDPLGPMQGDDGILVVGEPREGSDAVARMRIFNADGSEAEMCGNGVRCVARYLGEGGAGTEFAIETLAGRIAARIVGRDPFAACVDIGHVTFPNALEEERFEALGSTWRFYDVSLGNPHAVVFVPDVAALDLAALGASVQRLARFPAGTNLHVVQVDDATTLRARHFERGVGLTQACGTGAVACAVAAIATRGVASPVTVNVPGGTLAVAWETGASARLTGGAEELFVRTVAL
jgi:diaminopimelate epimerase